MSMNVKRSAVVVLVVLACMGGSMMARSAKAKSLARANGFIEHGVAAAVSRARGIAVTNDAAGRGVILAWLADHRGCRSLLMIDAQTGETKQYAVPFKGHDSPFAVILSSKEKFYSHCRNTFMEFDPAKRKFTFSGATQDRVAMSMTEDSNGVIWAGTYPKSHVVSYDPKTRKLTDYGPLNKETWPQYPRTMAVDAAGWVYIGIGNTNSHIVAINPKTREIVPLADKDERKHGGGHVFLAKDGTVYGRPHTKGKWYTLFEGKRIPVPGSYKKLPAARAPLRTGSQEYVYGQFPDGSVMTKINVPDKWAEIKEGKDKKTRRLEFDYKSEGSHVLSLIAGPDGKLYGSTGHPLRVYCYDPVKDECTSNGLLNFNGHWNALAVQRGKVYGGRYGGGILYEYDVTRPWADRDPKKPNPRAIVGAAPTINRPHALLAHPDGRHLILTGTPGYGLTGGGMLIHDLETGKSELLKHTDLIENQATMALVALDDGQLLGGTTVDPGTGGATKAKTAELYLFDFATRKIVWHQALLPGTPRIKDLLVGPDKLVYGLAEGEIFFVFDPKSRALVHQKKVGYGGLTGGQAPRVMTLGPDGKIYAFFQQAIVRIEPGTFTHKKLATPPVAINIGIVLREGRLYFISGSRLWSYKVPGLQAAPK